MSGKTSTEDQFEKAYLTVAKIVQNHGEKYLPIFKRFHDEKQIRLAKQDLASIAIQAVLNSKT